MHWEQKLDALSGLADVYLKMRRPGNWYASMSGVEIKQGGMLAGVCGDGKNPEEAVNDLWRECVDELPADRYIVVNAHRDSRKAFRWSGYMWKEVNEELSRG